ncbi:MAG: pyridoxal-phosphate dependent enzyme [bacterium]
MTADSDGFPSSADILSAAERIKPYVRHTPLLSSATINKMLEAEVYFKCENFQKVGAFKARGATNAIRSLQADQLSNGVATHSSGNHAQALSWAASLAGAKAFIVMPDNSPKVKVDAVRGYGGMIFFCEPTLEARETTLKRVIEETGAIEIHPYNNKRIIAGQATAALEMINDLGHLDMIIAPVGGGGLLSGTALSTFFFSEGTKVIAAEPEEANDAWRSFQARQFIPSINPVTIADGLKTSLGSLTFPIILDHVHDIVTVSEASIIKAMRLIWERMKIIIEPSSAVPVAALTEKKTEVRNLKVGVILSGGNVDLDKLPWISHGKR